MGLSREKVITARLNKAQGGNMVEVYRAKIGYYDDDFVGFFHEMVGTAAVLDCSTKL